MATIFGETKIIENWDGYSADVPTWSKVSLKSLYLARFLRYKHFCVLQFLQKNLKIQNGRQFLVRQNFFFANWDDYSPPCEQKFH